ncbi:MAG: hypothetical protein JO299_12630 [Gammaproteobacteria bacterium]|nr:hypothetical protein [Gammaproteobacteria bacterium]
MRNARHAGHVGTERRLVLLEQRPATESVMPGMWELPSLLAVPNHSARMTVRHAIMNVNYIARIRDVEENEVEEVTRAAGERRWVSVREAGGMALTGLTRKVLKRISSLGWRDSAA